MSASYPTSAATDASLSIAVNSLQTTLSSGINSVVTSVPLTSATGFPTAGYVTIDTEVIQYTGISTNNLTGCTRGADGTTAASHLSNAPVSATVVAAHHNSLKDEVKAVEGDLVSAFGSITPAGPNATDTSILTRIESIVAQLKAIAGITNWYDAIAVSLVNKLSLAGGTLTDNLAFNPTTKGIVGTTTNDNTTAGNVGEAIRATVASTNLTTATFVDIASISLTAGDWDITGIVVFERNGATFADIDCEVGLSTSPGNNTTGLTSGDNYLIDNGATNVVFSQFPIVVPAWRLSLSTTTTVYLKANGSDFTGGPARATGRISARRVR